MNVSKKTFGAFVRQQREAKGIGLRKMATRLRASPTYLSMVERDETPPPSELKVKLLAQLIDVDVDVLLAMAGRVSSDLTEIIRERPNEMASFLRAAKNLTAEELNYLTLHVRKVISSRHSQKTIANPQGQKVAAGRRRG